MKKLFLLIPALFIAMMMNAKVIEIGSGTSNILYSTIAASSTENGDVIVLTDAGPYVNAYGNDDYTKLRKNLTIKAAPSVQPVIKFQVPFRISDAASVKFIGLKFDGSDLEPNVGYNYYFRVNSNQDNCLEFEDCEFIGTDRYMIYVHDGYKAKSLKFENCEFYGNTNYIVTGSASSHVDACEINNCYFHDNTWNPVYFVASSVANQQTCSELKVTNSTFANIDCTSEYRSVIDIKPYGDEITDAIKVLVDHCTFYNNSTINSDHSAIRPYKLSDVTISNCIFAHAESYARRATCCWGGSVSNCLTYNLTKDESKNGHGKYGGDMTLVNNMTANPLFTDAAYDDFSFAGNWVTMDLSPARGAATDGSDLGDPRWYSAETLPEVDFASPHQFIGPKALLAGQIGLNASNHIEYYDTNDKGTATWKIHATRACILSATLNMEAGSSSGHKFKVVVMDADGNSVGELAEPSSTSSDGNINLPGTLSIPAEGDYTVILYNLTAWSQAKLEGVTFAYIGGAVQAMQGTTNIADAWFSSNGTRADGKISYSSVGSGCWAKWNINVASAGAYNVTVNISGQYGHTYTVEFLKEGSETPISIAEDGIVYGNDETLYANEMGSVVLEAANYEMKVSNSVGDAAIHSVKLEYAGGAVITVPSEELIGNEAVLVDAGSLKVSKLANGNLKYGDNGTPLGEYVYWNIHATKSGLMNVIANVVYDTDKGDAAHQSSHQFLVELFSDLNATALATSAEASANNHTGEISLPAIEIPAVGDYIVKLTNQKQWSSAILQSLEFEYVGGDRATLPAAFDFTDALLSAKAQIYNDMLYFEEPGDHNPVGQWAKWNVKVAEAGTFLFTMNVTSSNGQSYKISILNGETVVDAFESGSLGTGDKTAKHYFNLVAGNYTVKLENMTAWSQGHIVSLVVTQPELLTIDEAAEDNSIIVANYQGGQKDIQITRTIVAGMYNTICLPFSVSSSQLQAIFGSDVELKQMSSAELAGDVLNLIFEDVTTGIYHGTPYLIKTSSDVVNPIFTNVEVRSKVGDATSGTNADFIGTLIKSEVPEGENNLFLGPNDRLYFSQTATPIKGMRAYFQVHGVANPSNAIKRARIVMNSQVATDVELVNSQELKAKSQKLMENGQLIIIRDGVRYNVMGAKLQ